MLQNTNVIIEEQSFFISLPLQSTLKGLLSLLSGYYFLGFESCYSTEVALEALPSVENWVSVSTRGTSGSLVALAVFFVHTSVLQFDVPTN